MNDQRLHSTTGVVGFLLAEAGVNHVNDTVDCQGRLGNVRCYDNLKTAEADTVKLRTE